MKPISLLIGIIFASNMLKGSECPVHAKIGNAINFARLFKEQADSDWSYQNMETDFKLRLHLIEPQKGLFETHKIVFEIIEKNAQGKSWLYCIQALYDETDILQKIERFARFRVYENANNQDFSDSINQLVVDNFFNHRIRAYNPDGDNDLAEHYLYTLHNRNQTSCSPMTKMEYDYFYYLYTNYYKSGGNQGWGLIEPGVSSAQINVV